jgi:thiamine-phosphate pyrophosphorylase
MRWQDSVFRQFKLYAVTDITEYDLRVTEAIEAVYRGGADIVQLRSKCLKDSELFELGRRIRQIAYRLRKLFFVNDRPDVAIAVSADGIHIGQDDLPVSAIRKMIAKCGRKMFVGKSTHSLSQARKTAAERVDYIGVGPIFKTPTKKSYVPVGLELIRQVKQEIRKPFVVIGGIDESNIDQVMQAGAGRVAVVRALFSMEDPQNAAKRLRKKIESYE